MVCLLSSKILNLQFEIISHKMSKKLAIALALSGSAALFFSCNSDSDTTSTLDSSAVVRSFTLTADENILNNLDSIYFSIDLKTCEIFNADSLPYGTKVTNLIPVITIDAASVAELTVSRAGKSDTVYNYITSSTDSIDFTNPVKLRVVSLSGTTERNYTIRVNVHKVVGDTLIWSDLQASNIPSTFSHIDGQKTVQRGETFFCLTNSGNLWNMASTKTPGETWSHNAVTFGFTPDVNSFTATDNDLYILDTDHNLYESTDEGQTWQATGKKMHYLYGNFGTELLGSMESSGSWSIVTYPTLQTYSMPTGFPVSGTSQTFNFTPEMAVNSQLVMTGGQTAAGALSRDTWGFDGSSWVKISKTALPYAMKEVTLVPYYVVKTDTVTWRTNTNSALIAMFGTLSDGALNDTVYISRDLGMHWAAADSTMQINGAMKNRTAAQGFVASSTMHVNSRAASKWHDINGITLPAGARYLDNNRSRATELITEWECPYIYVFGGKDADGQQLSQMWRGFIRRFTFKPIQ